jgi:predicted RNA-binding protein
MALIDDIEFYGSRVDAGDIDREQAAQLLAEASRGVLPLRGARQAIDTWEGIRDRMQALRADVAAVRRAMDNGRPVPDHVESNARAERRASVLRRLRRQGPDSLL